MVCVIKKRRQRLFRIEEEHARKDRTQDLKRKKPGNKVDVCKEWLSKSRKQGEHFGDRMKSTSEALNMGHSPFSSTLSVPTFIVLYYFLNSATV
jgi:hypothetical protein